MLENGALILGFFLNQQHFTQREYFSVNAVTFRILSVERGLCVHVCICMSECESVSVSAFLMCAFFCGSFTEDMAQAWGVVERAQTLNPGTAIYFACDSLGT